jgi:hypothetical protein
MDMTIYVLGNIDFTHRILVGLSMLYQNRAIHLMAASLLILFTMWGFIKWMLNPDNTPYPFREFAFGIIFYMIFGGLQFISPRVNVQLETDTYSGTTFEVRTINDIPVLAVAPAWIMTNLFRGLRDTIAPLLYIPGEMSGAGYPGVGNGMDPLAVLIDANDMSMGAANTPRFPYIEKSVRSYIKDCFVTYHSLTGTPTQSDFSPLLNSPVSDIWATTSVPVNWLTTTYYDDARPSGINMVCQAAHTAIAGVSNTQLRAGVTTYLTGLNISATDFQNSMGLVLNSFDNATMPNPYDFMIGKFLSTYIGQVLVESPTVMMGNKMMFEASQKRVFERAAESNMFVQVMVPLITAIEAFAFFIAPILLLFTVLGGTGMAYIGKYLMLTVFINLWGFIKIFTDFFMLLTVHLSFTGDLSVDTTINPFTFINQYSTYMQLENFLSVASSLTVAIPLLAMFLLYGGVHSLMGVMRTMTNASADASNLAPNMASSYSGGELKMGNTTNQALVGSSSFGRVHTTGSSAEFREVTANQGIGRQGSEILSEANARLRTNTTSLGTSINELWGTTTTGGDNTTAGVRNGTSFSEAREQVNAIARGIGANVEKGQGDNASATARLAAQFAMQLRSGNASINAGDVDKYSNDELKELIKTTGQKSGIGLGFDASLQGISQLTEQGVEGFKEDLKKALTFMESDKSGQLYSQGFDFSKMQVLSDQDTVAKNASEVRSNLEAVQDSQNQVEQVTNTLGSSTAISESKAAKWFTVDSALQDKYGNDHQAAFSSLFSSLKTDTQDAMYNRYALTGANRTPDSLYSAMVADTARDGNLETNATKLMVGATKDFIDKTQDYASAADIYRTAGGVSGYSLSFDINANALDSLAATRNLLDENKLQANSASEPEQMNIPTSVNTLTPESGAPAGTETIKSNAVTATSNTPIDQTEVKAKEMGLKADGSKQTSDIPDLQFTEGAGEKLMSIGERFKNQDDIFDDMSMLRGGVDLIKGAMDGVQNVADYMIGNQPIWGESASSWVPTATAMASANGLSSGGLEPGLTDLLTDGGVPYLNLKNDLQNNDTAAFEKLSQLNDAALFITNTDAGRTAFQALNEDDQQRLLSSIVKTEGLVNGLDESSPISTAQMNAISTARLSGEITDDQAQGLIRMGTEDNIQWNLFGDGDVPLVGGLIGSRNVLGDESATNSTLYSAAFGNISQNSDLLSIVTNSDSTINTGLAPHGRQQPGDLVESLREGKVESWFTEKTAEAYRNDVISDAVDNFANASTLSLNDGVVTGVNSESPSRESINHMVSNYVESVTSLDSNGEPFDYKGYNDSVISQTDSNSGRASQAWASLAVTAATVDISSIIQDLSPIPEQQASLRDAWADLGAKAQANELTMDAEYLEGLTLQRRNDADFKG